MTRFASIVDVHVVFEVGGQVLFGLRANTGWADGMWHLPAGHLEPDESITAASCREVVEEVGVTVDPADLEFVHVMHHDDGDGAARVGFFFRAKRWTGTLVNAEPHKCAKLGWFAPHALPSETVGYASAALRNINNKILFSEYAQPPGSASA
jgi:8-oxo-dGTP pyrophosphatase MutT (NUDIX family)